MTSALRWAAMRAILMFQWKWWTKSQDSVHKPQPFWRERRTEAVSNRGPSAYQPNALPLGQTGSQKISKAPIPLLKAHYCFCKLNSKRWACSNIPVLKWRIFHGKGKLRKFNKKIAQLENVRKWRKTIKRKWRNSPTASIRQKKKFQVWFRALILTDESMKEIPCGEPPLPPKKQTKTKQQQQQKLKN